MIVACCFLLFFGGKTLSYGQDKKINLREEGSPSSSQSRKNRSVAGRKLKVYRRASGSVRFLPLPSEWPGSSSENVSGGAVPVAGTGPSPGHKLQGGRARVLFFSSPQ